MNADQTRGKEYWNKTRLWQNPVMMQTSVPSEILYTYSWEKTGKAGGFF